MGQHLDSDRVRELEEERKKLTPEQKLKLMNELRNVEADMSEDVFVAKLLYDKQQEAKKELPIIEKEYKEVLECYEKYKKAVNNKEEIDNKWAHYYRLETRQLELIVLLDKELDKN